MFRANKTGECYMTNENPIRYFVGCQPRVRGGWFVAAVIVRNGKETSRFYRTDIQTKKEAKELCGQLNEELIFKTSTLI
jgi:hypothetical protein